ncbi:MAG: flagellum biosynthesis protein FlbT [Rhodospirillales bacterium]|nr:flagellum biosynthesis protein FlbT [Rhodospirillales bacterium]
MPLKLQIKAGQRIIVNGAVVENIGTRTAALLVKNEAAIMRDTDILTPEDAVTPASRAYYALQCLYLFPSQTDKYLPLFKDLSAGYAEAAPSAREIIDGLREHVDQGQFYMALKKARDLIQHEAKVLTHVG